MSSTAAVDPATESKRKAAARGATGAKPKAPRQVRPAAAAEDPKLNGSQHDQRVTKRERVLTLLSRPEGASIAEMMQATNWRQHSVRGFLAGTVKKRLGFVLTSSIAAGDVRGYRIKARRGR